MSLTEILAEIPKLSFAERQELVRHAIALEAEELTPEENAILDERLADFRRDPISGIPRATEKRSVAAAEAAMIQKIIFRQPAVEDVTEAAAWYEAHAPGTRGTTNRGDTFSDTSRANNPELFRTVDSDGEAIFPSLPRSSSELLVT